MRASLVAFAAAALVLAGCGKAPADAAASDAGPPGAGDGRIAAAPAPPPDFVPIYPGATIDTSVSGGAGGGSGGAFTFQTHDKPADVIAFYKSRTAAEGFASTFSSQSGDGLMFSAGKQGADDGVQVIATPADGATAVQVIWTGPRKG